MKVLWIVAIVAILAGLFAPPPPDPGYTVWPSGIDDVWTFIETEQPGWTFEGECEAQPVITWAMVREIASANADGDTARVVIGTARLAEIGLNVPAAGTLDISEQELFGVAMWSVLGGAWRYGYNPLCKPEGDKVGIYGRAAEDLAASLAEYVK